VPWVICWKKNEKSKEVLAGSIAGNYYGKKNSQISLADAVILKNFGFSRVEQIFGSDQLTGQVDLSKCCQFPHDLANNYQNIVQKCKELRRVVGSRGGRYPPSVCHISIILKRLKCSGLYRKMAREEVDSTFKGPPSYYTRIKDGFPVPALDKYMQGYNNLFRANLPTKTLEISFNIMNRQAWTNQKQYKSGVDGGGSQGLCTLCGSVENTHHLLFECEEYAEIFWRILGSVFSQVEEKTIQLHMFNVIYNIKYTGLSEKSQKSLFLLIQEGKRSIVKRRVQRCLNPNLDNIIHDEKRVTAHWVNIVRRLISLRKYQGKNIEEYEKLQNALINNMG